MAQKEINWFFHWRNGGYNSVKATSRSEALAKAVEKGRAKYPGHVTLEPSEASLKADADYALTNAQSELYSGMFD